jgi:hypothetical protein
MFRRTPNWRIPLETKMTLNDVASSDASALAIRDHVLPIIRAQGSLEDLEYKDSSLRLVVLEREPWRFLHWTPFNALAPTEASSPGYRHALERQHTRSNLPYGLEVWHDGANVLSLLWAGLETFAVVRFVRGPWEEAAMAI